MGQDADKDFKSSTPNVTDSWIDQADVRHLLTAFSRGEGQWIAVHENRDSYIEHFLCFILPITRQRALKTMAHPAWSDDFEYTKGKIAELRSNHQHYLGLRFR